MFLVCFPKTKCMSLILKKGRLLFKEGDKSRAMYLIKSGAIRLFTKKGNTTIEIDTIRAGQILGELAFLDGNPRSLSGEAIQDCELIEISGATFLNVLTKAPDWLKILLRTVVGRLRAANTRIRQLEASTASISYDKDGNKRTGPFQYITYLDFCKVGVAFLLAASRNSTKCADGLDIDMGWVNRYSYLVMGVANAKITAVIDILVHAEFATQKSVKGVEHLYFHNVDQFEKVLEFLISENQRDVTTRTSVSSQAISIMTSIFRSLSHLPKNVQGHSIINLENLKNASDPKGQCTYKKEDFLELIQAKIVGEFTMKPPNQAITTVHAEQFIKDYYSLKTVDGIKEVNEQKNEVSGTR